MDKKCNWRKYEENNLIKWEKLDSECNIKEDDEFLRGL